MCNDSAAAHDRADGTPEDMEIEITAQMLEDGLSKLYKYRYDIGNDEDVVSEIFRSMVRLSPQVMIVSRR